MKRFTCTIIGLTALAFVGCSAGGESSPSESLASARIRLETATDSGNVYKLQDAVFEFTGPTNTSVTSDSIGPYVEVDVAPGRYDILLKDGWTLVHTTTPTGEILYRDMPAALITPNPVDVTLPAGQVTPVNFLFDIAKDPLKKNEARARIGIGVEGESLCGNGTLDEGEECDSAINYSGASCDSLCTGGYKPCTESTDCASGYCGLGTCKQCEETAIECRGQCRDADDDCKNDCYGDIGACNSSCDTSENACRNTCGRLSELCWAGCWFDPIGCAATCEPPRTICMNECGSAADSCHDRCDNGQTCIDECESTHAACETTCDATEDDCSSDCRQCLSCTEAEQCPYLTE